VKEGGGEETARMAGGPEKAIFVRTDTTSEADVQRLMESAVSTFGSVDMVHNNAAILTRYASIEEIDVDEFRRVVDVNLTGVFLVMKPAVPIMKRQRSGVIVNMSSMGAIGSLGVLAYSAAKAGVLAMTRAMGQALAEDGIRVNALMPGLVETPMTEGGPVVAGARAAGQPIFKPEDMARAVAFCAEREDLNAAYVQYVPTREGGHLGRMREFEWEALAM
jgi:NAD(P)-dependent dehydrogenase (short-subunit alcohol dehydrogenase family)